MINYMKIPTAKELEEELKYEQYKTKYKQILKSTIYILMVVVAISVLLATLMFPVLKICGKSMMPTLLEGDLVLCMKKKSFNQGDIVAFYYNNRILVKRVIATSSDWVDIDENGNVFVNNKLLYEPYISNKSLGETDILFPYQVKEDSYFVMGEARETSIDSRSYVIGSVSKDDILGVVVFKLWPMKRIGTIK